MSPAEARRLACLHQSPFSSFLVLVLAACLGLPSYARSIAPRRGALQKAPDALHMEGERLALRSRFGEAWAPAA